MSQKRGAQPALWPVGQDSLGGQSNVRLPGSRIKHQAVLDAPIIPGDCRRGCYQAIVAQHQHR